MAARGQTPVLVAGMKNLLEAQGINLVFSAEP